MHDIRPQPSDATAMKPPFAWESAEHRQAQHDPTRPTRQSRDIVGGEELLPGREPLIDPGRENDVRKERAEAAAGRESSAELINDLHVWFRSFRVKLSRMRKLCTHHKEKSSAVSRKIQRNLPAPTAMYAARSIASAA